MKAIAKNLKGLVFLLVTQTKNSLQTPGLSDQLLKITDQYKCLVKLIETMESAIFTIKEAVQAFQQRDFRESLAPLTNT